jgi:hypothetical protein
VLQHGDLLALVWSALSVEAELALSLKFLRFELCFEKVKTLESRPSRKFTPLLSVAHGPPQSQ